MIVSEDGIAVIVMVSRMVIQDGVVTMIISEGGWCSGSGDSTDVGDSGWWQ